MSMTNVIALYEKALHYMTGIVQNQNIELFSQDNFESLRKLFNEQTHETLFQVCLILSALDGPNIPQLVYTEDGFILRWPLIITLHIFNEPDDEGLYAIQFFNPPKIIIFKDIVSLIDKLTSLLIELR